VVLRCLPLSAMTDMLRDGYNETRVAHGVSADGHLLEVFSSPDGTYTAVKVSPSGLACVVDFGAGWQMRPRVIDDTTDHSGPPI